MVWPGSSGHLGTSEDIQVSPLCCMVACSRCHASTTTSCFNLHNGSPEGFSVTRMVVVVQCKVPDIICVLAPVQTSTVGQ